MTQRRCPDAVSTNEQRSNLRACPEPSGDDGSQVCDRRTTNDCGPAVSAVVVSDCASLSFAEAGPTQIPVAGLTQPEVQAAEAFYPFPPHASVTAMSTTATNNYDRDACRLRHR